MNESNNTHTTPSDVYPAEISAPLYAKPAKTLVMRVGASLPERCLRCGKVDAEQSKVVGAASGPCGSSIDATMISTSCFLAILMSSQRRRSMSRPISAPMLAPAAMPTRRASLLLLN